MKANRLVVLACAAVALAFVPAVVSSQAVTPKTDVDAAFQLLAMQGNDAEIDMSQLALERSNALEVRGFAQKMIAEHTDLMHRLVETIPSAAHPPARVNALDRLALERLATLPAADFDQEYIVQQIGDHLATIDVFETEARIGGDPVLKAFAARELPTIRAHLDLAVNEAKHIGGAGPFFQH
ncbi:MAG: DUF4142 domain-containing protein [Candidatus Eremiobacteraeota bacterium]|nr:DUF4142 domain-containing protein [Candidatus Eremiobacteraeota bacterium]